MQWSQTTAFNSYSTSVCLTLSDITGLLSDMPQIFLQGINTSMQLHQFLANAVLYSYTRHHAGDIQKQT